MEFLRRLRDQFGAFWGSLNPIRRILLIVIGLAVVIGIGVFTYLSQTHSGYVVLAKDQPLDEIGAIRTKLTASSIPNELEDGGSTIVVPKDRLAAARVALAVDGIPIRGGKGYELFDESALGSTPFVQNVNYQRALQAELGRSLMQIDGVMAARVLIARPEPTPFIRDQRAPTASVVLKLRPNANFSRATSSSIVSIVARAVDGLKPENVTIVDSTGRLLSDPNAADRDNLPTGQLEYLRELETYLASKAENMLNRHLGPGRAVVSVHADVNFQKVKEKTVSYSVDKVALEERTTTSSSTAAPRGGVAGATSNISRTGGASSSAGGAGTKEEVTQTSYAVPQVTREMEDRMGAVTRITIAALVDLSPGEEGQPTAKPISATDAQEIIKQAIGYKTGRDEIKVSDVRLGIAVAPLGDDEEALKAQKLQTYVSLVRNVALTAATIFAFAMIPLLFLRRVRKLGPAKAPEPEPIALAPAPEMTRQAMLNQLIDLARGNPDRVANVFGMLVSAKNSG